MGRNIQLHKIFVLVLLASLPFSMVAGAQDTLPDDYCRWKVVDYGTIGPRLAGIASRLSVPG